MDQNLIIKNENFKNIEILHNSSISTIQLVNIFRKKMIIKKLNDLNEDITYLREIKFMKMIRNSYFPRLIGIHYSNNLHPSFDLKNKSHSINCKTDNINIINQKENKKNKNKKMKINEEVSVSYNKSKTSIIGNDSSLCIVMENIKGISLDKFIEKGPEKAIIYLHINNLCQAIDFINQNSYIHKDIKTQNIIVDNKFRLKLIDFGITSKISDLDKFNHNEGTLLYVSPEVLREQINKDINYKIDIWSLGIVLSEIYSGEKPWKFLNSANIKAEDIKDYLDSNDTYYIDEKIIDPLEQEFIKQCTYINSEKRFSSKDTVIFSGIMLHKYIKKMFDIICRIHKFSSHVKELNRQEKITFLHYLYKKLNFGEITKKDENKFSITPILEFVKTNDFPTNKQSKNKKLDKKIKSEKFKNKTCKEANINFDLINDNEIGNLKDIEKKNIMTSKKLSNKGYLEFIYLNNLRSSLILHKHNLIKQFSTNLTDNILKEHEQIFYQKESANFEELKKQTCIKIHSNNNKNNNIYDIKDIKDDIKDIKGIEKNQKFKSIKRVKDKFPKYNHDLYLILEDKNIFYQLNLDLNLNLNIDRDRMTLFDFLKDCNIKIKDFDFNIQLDNSLVIYVLTEKNRETKDIQEIIIFNTNLKNINKLKIDQVIKKDNVKRFLLMKDSDNLILLLISKSDSNKEYLILYDINSNIKKYILDDEILTDNTILFQHQETIFLSNTSKILFIIDFFDFSLIKLNVNLVILNVKIVNIGLNYEIIVCFCKKSSNTNMLKIYEFKTKKLIRNILVNCIEDAVIKDGLLNLKNDFNNFYFKTISINYKEILFITNEKNCFVASNNNGNNDELSYIEDIRHIVIDSIKNRNFNIVTQNGDSIKLILFVDT